jgi:methylmalonyl-CoA mutase
MANNNLFDIFSSATKEEWLTKVEKDLKGKPLKDLYWKLEEGLELPPFFHPDDMSRTTQPIAPADPYSQNNWEIGEYIKVTDSKTANQQLLEGLNGGVEAPLLLLDEPVDRDFLTALFKGIEHSYISTNIRISQGTSADMHILSTLIEYFVASDLDLTSLRGTLDISAYMSSVRYDASSLAAFVQKSQQNLPSYSVLSIDVAKEYQGIGHTSTELSEGIKKGEKYLFDLLKEGIDADTISHQLFFNVAIGKSYFVEIAKIRALKILWANVLKSYNLSIQPPLIIAHLSIQDQDEEVNTNMIRTSTQAVSAAVSGVQKMYIPPANWAKGEESTSFTRRIARNVQHLLKMESHLQKVIDPSAGSYYMEKLTQKLVAEAWSKFATTT